jgi:hypothetical protein
MNFMSVACSLVVALALASRPALAQDGVPDVIYEGEVFVQSGQMLSAAVDTTRLAPIGMDPTGAFVTLRPEPFTLVLNSALCMPSEFTAMIHVYKGADVNRIRDLIANEKQRTGFEDGTDDFDAQDAILDTLFEPGASLPIAVPRGVLASGRVGEDQWPKSYNLFTPDRFASLSSNTATIAVSGIEFDGENLMVPGGSATLLLTTFGGCNSDSELSAKLLVIDFAEG